MSDIQSASKSKGLWKLILMVVILGVLMVLAYHFQLGGRLGQLKEWIGNLGPLGPIVFILVYIAATIVMIPGSPLTLVAGAIFGSVLGVIVVSIGSTLGATLCFLIARYFARDSIGQWLAGKEKFRQLDEMTERQGGRIVAVTRLVPFFPFALLNYGFGLTKVGFLTYVFFSWLCMLPGSALYVIGGEAIFEAILEGKVPWGLIVAVVIVLAVVLVLGLLIKKRLNKTDSPAATAPRQAGE